MRPPILAATGRRQWAEVRPFFDHVLALGEEARKTAVRAIAQSLRPPTRPDRTYVDGLLARDGIPEDSKDELRTAYGIK